MAMTLVSTVTVGSGGAASIEFTGIPQTGKDLLVLTSLRSNSPGSSDYLVMFLNNNTGANYSQRLLLGSGSAASSTSETSVTYTYAGFMSATTSTASTFGNSQAYIANYTVSAGKSFSVDGISENNATAAQSGLIAGLWNQTAAITSLQLQPSNGNFSQHSTASLYIIS
jgi:hypothetical protein